MFETVREIRLTASLRMASVGLFGTALVFVLAIASAPFWAGWLVVGLGFAWMVAIGVWERRTIKDFNLTTERAKNAGIL